PLHYILGEREFWSLPLAVDRRVLVPRPETELVVETALRLAPAARRVLDVGTGSGAIAAALARELPAARVWASDVDTDALAVARANLARQAPGVALVCGDLLAPFRTAAFDLVAANPPYVADAELGGLAPEVRDHEPPVALAAGPDGLAALGRLMAEAPRVLAAGGWGEVVVSGSQNAALPLLFATLLTRERSVVRNVPALADVRTAIQVLEHLGARVTQSADGHEVAVEPGAVACTEAPYELVKTMRASFLVLGPLLARFGHARVSTPGGCAIGARPVDLHLSGLQKLGARLRISEGYVEAEAERLRGAKIVLDFSSLGATQQLMMAAALAEGTTVLENAAREPEN